MEQTLLESTSISELIFDSSKVSGLIEVQEDTKLITVLESLLKNHIHSVPVYRVGPRDKKQYTGILSIWEVMTFLVFNAYCSGDLEASEESLSSHKLDPELTAGAIVGSIEEESKTLWFYEPTTSINVVLEAMSKGVHRVLTTQKSDTTGKDVMVIVSQMDVVCWLKKQMDKKKFAKIAETRAEELNLANPLGSDKLQWIKSTSPAIEGFLKMVQKGLQALPVQDEEGKLIANFSMTDLESIVVPGIEESTADFSILTKSVEQYLKSQNEENKLVHPISVSSRTHLSEIIDRIVAAHVHRVWVTNSAEQPIGAISLTDIIEVVFKKFVLNKGE